MSYNVGSLHGRVKVQLCIDTGAEEEINQLQAPNFPNERNSWVLVLCPGQSSMTE
ncbi:hypothetical protein J6590_080296 [Homalodisca vitripennis]|nr:hypothetical protein J6590_100398 [Homalodisca vitripennis]KAG8300249.1 hypothetical protein J6590_080296 [Homalodisca vitripennis]